MNPRPPHGPAGKDPRVPAAPTLIVGPERARGLAAAMGLQVTDEQAAIVFGAPLSPAVVIAGAGSGKTAVMAARIAALAASGLVPASEILGLTFTRKAAAELSERVGSYLRAARRAGLADPDGGEPEVGTYHSFAQRFVREHGIWIGIDPDLRVEADFALLPLAFRVAARSQALTSVPHQLDLGSAVAAMRTLDGELAEHAVTTDALRTMEARRQAAMARARPSQQVRDLVGASIARTAVSVLVDEYRQAKADEAVMDYADMMRLAHAAAVGSEQARTATRERYRAVLLDEYQDTSVVQRLLLQALFGAGHPVMAVGDPKQSIYGFRGAAEATIERFADHFPAADGTPASTYTLSANFRSGPAIVAVANASAAARRAADGGAAGVDLRVGRADARDAVEVRGFRSESDERDFVVAEVVAELAAGRAPGDVLVLARSNDSVGAVAARLEGAGVPVVSSDTAGLFELPEIRDVLAMLAVTSDAGANGDLVRLLVSPRWRIGLRDLNLLGSRARELAGRQPDDGSSLAQALVAATAGLDPVEAPSLLDALADPGAAAYSDAARERFAALHAELEVLAVHAGDPVHELIARVVRMTAMDVELLLGEGAERRAAALDTLLALAHSFHTSSPGSGLPGFLRAVRMAGQADADPGFEAPVAADAVRVMTVHKSKGLQAAVVFLPGFTAGAYDKVELREHWTVYPGALPDDLRGDRTTPPGGVHAPLAAKEIEGLREASKSVLRAEAERLVYVALTRARERLVATTHAWHPDRQRPREPSTHLEALAELEMVALGQWYVPEEGGANPVAGQAAEASFPQWDAAATRRRAGLAGAVREAARAHHEDPDVAAEQDADAVGRSALLRAWDADIAALRRERDERRTAVAEVALPDSLSATAMQRLLADPQEYATELRRPMPQRPSRAARRGTRFHDWVAARWEQRALIDTAEFASDADLDDTGDGLDELIAAFEASTYAQRPPTHIEYPFATVVAGLPVAGRIDAVYRDQGRWEVVDWKTSRAADADPMQLAVYRLAWAKVAGVDPAEVDAAFYYVASGTRVAPPDLPDEAALGALLRERLEP